MFVGGRMGSVRLVLCPWDSVCKIQIGHVSLPGSAFRHPSLPSPVEPGAYEFASAYPSTIPCQ